MPSSCEAIEDVCEAVQPANRLLLALCRTVRQARKRLPPGHPEADQRLAAMGAAVRSVCAAFNNARAALGRAEESAGVPPERRTFYPGRFDGPLPCRPDGSEAEESHA